MHRIRPHLQINISLRQTNSSQPYPLLSLPYAWFEPLSKGTLTNKVPKKMCLLYMLFSILFEKFSDDLTKSQFKKWKKCFFCLFFSIFVFEKNKFVPQCSLYQFLNFCLSNFLIVAFYYPFSHSAKFTFSLSHRLAFNPITQTN